MGFIPVFSDKPHAYSYFHVSEHYFTISCILVPAITVLYRKVSGRLAKGEFFAIAFANVTALAIPFLCVSRFQLLFAVGFAVVTYIMGKQKNPPSYHGDSAGGDDPDLCDSDYISEP